MRLQVSTLAPVARPRMTSTSTFFPRMHPVLTRVEISRRKRQFGAHHRRLNNRGLPPELLLLIFEHVYADSTLNGEWIACSPQSRTQFPFAPAAVCKAWRDVLASVPRFWTRIIINLDTTKLSDINTYLHLSRKLTFEITVTRDQRFLSNSRTNNDDEGAQAATVMALIVPHLHRCRALCFQLLRSSSLPALRHLNVTAPLLERLKLQCGVDDGEHPLVGSLVPEQWRFYAPVLRHLFLNGRNLRDACALRWVESLQNLEDLCVSRYSGGKYPTGELHLHDVLLIVDRLHRLFGILQKLTLQDVSFDGILTREDGYDIQIEAVSLQSIDLSTVRTIFMSKTGPAPRLVHIKHELSPCAYHIRLTQADTLVLEGPFSHMANAINIWDGNCLSIKNCPTFDDRTIRDIHRLWDPNKLTSPNWSQLKIDNCTEFSADALLALIDARNDAVQRARDRDITSQAPFNNLQVLQVYGGPPISPEDADAFKERLLTFEWHEAATGITH
ncbi:uncharacterized protein F5891DRAFT_83912 [Suillus fuscotomentosus]|uniref:F-box domain-containing protein n=1 Tax=Suillus fuscotomentosus TaxID=1912939 RepID=A0AAD4ECI4_9AGAM|nr:uncharacterized protein F5891DRAFT_83912 [Suillus fuscotomentosus]KAG1903729.1 hypothetical protein F5891DRAFT_83912 [Suillus fuscotomentosus]